MNVSIPKLVTALTILTQKGEIQWHLSDSVGPTQLYDGGVVDGHIYEAKVKDKVVRLLRYSYGFDDDYGKSYRDFSFRLITLGYDVGAALQPETEIDDKSVLGLLYDLVRETCHGVDDWAEDVVQLARSTR